ncbi:hypothetical protein JL722_364 [Aureococcus anophagefferens]|nr:hypothetical protein JL722_364 [Aureococcus anophagefferens]
MRRRSRLPTPSNVRNNKTAQEDVPIEGARLEALRAHAKRSVAASHAAAAAPPKAPWSEAATALLSICFFVALCVMGFWLEGDLESARKRQAGDCAFEEAVAGYVWPALTLPGEGLNGELACCVVASAPAGPWLCGGDDEAAVPPARDVLISVVERAPVRTCAYLDVGARGVRGVARRAAALPRGRRGALALLDVGDDLMHARDLDVGDGEARPAALARPRARAPPTSPRPRPGLQRLDAGVAKYDAVLDWDDRGELGLVEQQLALDADVAWAQADAATDPPFKVGIGPCGWQGRFIRTVLDARAHDGRPVRSWYDPELVLWPPS